LFRGEAAVRKGGVAVEVSVQEVHGRILGSGRGRCGKQGLAGLARTATFCADAAQVFTLGGDG
jgi:hypothetical protein